MPCIRNTTHPFRSYTISHWFRNPNNCRNAYGPCPKRHWQLIALLPSAATVKVAVPLRDLGILGLLGNLQFLGLGLRIAGIRGHRYGLMAADNAACHLQHGRLTAEP